MGLIDSTNRIERAILSDKQAKRLEREEKKREKAIKDRDKLEKEIATDTMAEGLAVEISAIYEALGYMGANLYYKSLEARERTILKVAKNELEYKTACGLYDKILASIDKRHKLNEQYKLQAKELEELKQEQANVKKHNFNEICKIVAYCIYSGIIAIFKIIGFFLLICLGFTKFIFMIQPQHKRRYK